MRSSARYSWGGVQGWDGGPTLPCRDSHRKSKWSFFHLRGQSRSVRFDCPPLLPPLTTFQSYLDLQNFCAISMFMIDPDPNNQPSSNQDRPRSNDIYRISKFSSAGIQVFAPSRNREMRKERRGTGLSSSHHICNCSVSDTRVQFVKVVSDSVGPTFIRSRRSDRPSQGRRGPTHFFSWRSFSRDKRE
jgi:hypothetical protein